MKLKVTPVISLIRLAILSSPHTNSKYALINTMSSVNHTELSKSIVQGRLRWQRGNGLSLWKSNKQIWFLIWCFRSGVCAATGKFMMFEIHITNIFKEYHRQESLNKDVKKMYLQFNRYSKKWTVPKFSCQFSSTEKFRINCFVYPLWWKSKWKQKLCWLIPNTAHFLYVV